MTTDGTHGYRFTDQVGHLLRRAYQRHVAIFQETVPDAQLTAAQFVVLCAVRDRGAPRVPVHRGSLSGDAARGASFHGPAEPDRRPRAERETGVAGPEGAAGSPEEAAGPPGPAMHDGAGSPSGP